MMSLSFSRRRTENDQSAMQTMHREAKVLLEKKNQEIDKLNSEIEKAETKLSKLKKDLKSITDRKSNESESDDSDFLSDDDQKEIDQIKDKHQIEIQQISERYEEEAANLEDMYIKQLKEAEGYVQQHADQVYIEKNNELAQLKEDVRALHEKNNQVIMESTRRKQMLLTESTGASMTNAQKIQYLEQQLTDVAAISREEIREIRSKIAETIEAYDIRKKDQENERNKIDLEYQNRNKRYEAHIQALQQQYQSEKDTISAEIESNEDNYKKLQRIIKHLDKQREKQLSTAIRDNEKMKTTIYQVKTRDAPSLETTRTLANRMHANEQQCHNLKEEIKLIDAEIKEIVQENKELQSQLLMYQQRRH